MKKLAFGSFAHLANPRRAVRPEDLPPGTPFAHLLGGCISPSRIEGWEHRTRDGGYTTNSTKTKERAR